MSDFFYRTEDIRPEEVLEYFVETKQDREIVENLKNRNPTILIGSRGVGKSFLLRVAQKELLEAFPNDRVFPVYISFVKSSLLQSSNENQFQSWMISKISTELIRSLSRHGLLGSLPKSLSIVAGNPVSTTIQKTKIEEISEAFENSWKSPQEQIDVNSLPNLDELKNALDDLAYSLDIKRFVLLIDEAAHIFLPEQQRQFFTLFRDLRAHYLTCNAAVYPGVTSFGDTFQPTHDATVISLNRDILSPDYIENMREIVQKQADSSVLANIAQNGKNFSILAYASTGNPRVLLKNVAASQKMNSTQVNDTIRNYYRSEIWSEHSNLSEKYSGHKGLIDWGRNFIENDVVREIKKKNDNYLATDRDTSAFIWIHRDAPEIVKESLRILAYTGIVIEHASGIKATRSEIGKRYLVNLGCLFAAESTPTGNSFEIAKGLTPRRMTEFGANYPAFKELAALGTNEHDSNISLVLKSQLEMSIEVLDLTLWQKSKLQELGLSTVRDVLSASEEALKAAMYVGNVRARKMRNAAEAAVLEYLSG